MFLVSIQVLNVHGLVVQGFPLAVLEVLQLEPILQLLQLLLFESLEGNGVAVDGVVSLVHPVCQVQLVLLLNPWVQLLRYEVVLFFSLK